jgi:GTP-binding protein EngB required for normal cell division
MEQVPIRILVFGGTGVGKTSLCNSLTGKSRPTDSGAKGVTDKTHLYGVVERGGLRLEVVDTVGLHEAESGTVPAEAAARQLVELLSHSKDGYNLLIHVAIRGRLTRQHEDDYEFFVRRLTNERIPVLLVLTGCENDSPMSSWVDANRKHFNHFNYRDLIATCFGSGGPLEAHFAPLRRESEAELLRAIRERALAKPMMLYAANEFTQFLAKVWNDFVELARLPAHFRAKANETVYEFLLRMGVPRKIADMCIEHIPDVFGIPGSGSLLRKLAKNLWNRVAGSPGLTKST